MIKINELYYIAPIEHIKSILEKGILCHNLTKDIMTNDLSLAGVQERRAKKVIPGGGKLHDFVNLYFDAHNPMLSLLRSHNNEICILKINGEVINIPGCILTDRNASSDYVKFFTVNEGKNNLDLKKIFDKYWHHDEYDIFDEMEHKSIKCAEVLIPEKLASDYIFGAYVINEDVKKKLIDVGFIKPIIINYGIFF
ncbi:DUF4433 domain-containing protein [bacterium]|nr:MAG: DUF4433 domain-containing protein [bacterium]